MLWPPATFHHRTGASAYSHGETVKLVVRVRNVGKGALDGRIENGSLSRIVERCEGDPTTLARGLGTAPRAALDHEP
jgi:hypothetical protein